MEPRRKRVDDLAFASSRLREVPVPELPPTLDVPAEGVERLLGHAHELIIVRAAAAEA